jgi:long-chain acyl-CoA synthetase
MDTTPTNPVDNLLREGGPFALQDALVEGRPCRIFLNRPQTLAEIQRKATVFGTMEFLVAPDRRLSYRDTLNQAARLSAALTYKIGLGKGDRIALALENGPDWVIAFLAITAQGATAVLTGRHDSTDFDHCAKIARCTHVIFKPSSDAPACIGQIDDKAIVLGTSLSALITAEEKPGAPQLASPDDEAIIAFTSGSTGKPKGVIVTHRGITSGLANMMLSGAMMQAASSAVSLDTPRRRPVVPCSLMLSPLSHIGGYGQLMLLMMLGGKLVFPENKSPDALLRTTAQEKATTWAGIPTHQLRALLAELPAQYDITSVLNLHISGTAISQLLLSDLAEKMPTAAVNASYGLTETNGSVCAISASQLREHPSSSGAILPSVEYRILNPDGSSVKDDQIGDIWLRGAMLMRGYCGDTPSELPEGWFKTGDVGHFSNGYLHVSGRGDAHSEITSSCLALERISITQVGVMEAAAFHIPDVTPTFHIAIMHKIGIHLDTQALRTSYRQQARLPDGAELHVTTFNELPRTRTGKIDRRQLATLLTQARQQAA